MQSSDLTESGVVGFDDLHCPFLISYVLWRLVRSWTASGNSEMMHRLFIGDWLSTFIVCIFDEETLIFQCEIRFDPFRMKIKFNNSPLLFSQGRFDSHLSGAVLFRQEGVSRLTKKKKDEWICQLNKHGIGLFVYLCLSTGSIDRAEDRMTTFKWVRIPSEKRKRRSVCSFKPNWLWIGNARSAIYRTIHQEITDEHALAFRSALSIREIT